MSKISVPIGHKPLKHYNDVKMSAITSQITSLTIVYSTAYAGTDKKNIKASRHWPLCREFTGDRWIPRTKGQLRGKCFHLMTSSCLCGNIHAVPQYCLSYQHMVWFHKKCIQLDSKLSAWFGCTCNSAQWKLPSTEGRWLLLKIVQVAFWKVLEQLVLKWTWQKKLVLTLLKKKWNVNCENCWTNGLPSPIVQFSAVENC